MKESMPEPICPVKLGQMPWESKHFLNDSHPSPSPLGPEKVSRRTQRH